MAGKLILTTVGTSALNREKLELLKLNDIYDDLGFDLSRLNSDNLRSWLEGTKVPNRGKQFIEQYTKELLELDIAKEVKKTKRVINVFSAEITSLYLMSISDDKTFSLDPEFDTLVLLLSDSPEGVLAGLMNKQCLECGKLIKGTSIQPKIAIIPELQSENISNFIKGGLKEFVFCIRKFMKAEPAKKAILNTTGGFKSLIPYATYLSLAWQIPMVFVFEDLPELIKINPIILNPSTEQRNNLLGLQNMIRDILPNNTGIGRDDIE